MFFKEARKLLVACGIIAEYNPFHNGHAYLVQEARKKSQADVVVAVMSGNFLQRGEPAILDKWVRANQALLNGVDLVIELPYFYAVQSADYFARGAISLLQDLQVEHLCFGTEGQQSLDYEAFARFDNENRQAITELFQQLRNNGMSYPQQMTEVYRQLYPEWPLDNSSPNHILGMSYAKENSQYAQPMKLHTVKRQQAHYHDKEIANPSFASATAIREHFLSQTNETLLHEVIPERTSLDLKEAKSHFVTWEKLWPYLQYQLLTSSVEQLQKIYQMNEGIEYRLLSEVMWSSSFVEFVSKVKTKRMTWTRIQRLCVAILIQATNQEVQMGQENPYLRVLGFTKMGQQFLKERKQKVHFPIITKVGRNNEKYLQLDIRAGRIYSLASGQMTEQDFYRSPIRI